MLLENSQLKNYTDYLLIGKADINQKPGKLVENTFICTITISGYIYSTKLHKIVKFIDSKQFKGNGVSESQALEYALSEMRSNFELFDY